MLWEKTKPNFLLRKCAGTPTGQDITSCHALRKLLCFHVIFSIETYAETQYYVSIEKHGGNHGISNVSGIKITRFALKFLTGW